MKSFSDSSSSWLENVELEQANSNARFAREYPLRILIAEDDYISRRCIVLLLQQLGYHADYVENGLECLTTVLKRPYDIILSDVDMPEMDGIECTRSIRYAGIDTPIIAVTADSLNNTREHCLNAGMNGYIMKPVVLDALKHALYEAFLKKASAPESRDAAAPSDPEKWKAAEALHLLHG